VKKQDQVILISATIRNPYAKDTTWKWLKSNMPHLRGVYEATGDLSRLLQSCIPILGIGRVEEVEKYFNENRVPEAQNGIKAGLEKLRIYQRLVSGFPADAGD
jgi:tricorn protease interacting factor F2/3